ncbi:MAG: exosortase system-associated protein, TIGR04073 family [Chthoniobacteraceae bacterium]
MKSLLSLALLSLFATTALADIQDPPINDQGPTRKLSRGLANFCFGYGELSYQPAMMNEREGNNAAWTYGIVKGVGRCIARMGYGVFEVLTFPFPTNRGSYKQPYKNNVPWIHGGMDEFPPELGWESRYHYVRAVYAYP